MTKHIIGSPEREYQGDVRQQFATLARMRALSENSDHQPDFITVIGPSCVGKSTLINRFMSVFQHNGGHVICGDQQYDVKKPDMFPPISINISNVTYNFAARLTGITCKAEDIFTNPDAGADIWHKLSSFSASPFPEKLITSNEFHATLKKYGQCFAPADAGTFAFNDLTAAVAARLFSHRSEQDYSPAQVRADIQNRRKTLLQPEYLDPLAHALTDEIVIKAASGISSAPAHHNIMRFVDGHGVLAKILPVHAVQRVHDLISKQTGKKITLINDVTTNAVIPAPGIPDEFENQVFYLNAANTHKQDHDDISRTYHLVTPKRINVPLDTASAGLNVLRWRKCRLKNARLMAHA